MNKAAPRRSFTQALADTASKPPETHEQRAALVLAGKPLVINMSGQRSSQSATIMKHHAIENGQWYTPAKAESVIALINTLYIERRKLQLQAEFTGAEPPLNVRNLPVYLYEEGGMDKQGTRNAFGTVAHLRSRFLRAKHQSRDLPEMIEQMRTRSESRAAKTADVTRARPLQSAQATHDYVMRIVPHPMHIVVADFHGDKGHWYSDPIQLDARQIILVINATDRPDLSQKLSGEQGKVAVIATFNEDEFIACLATSGPHDDLVLPLAITDASQIVVRPSSEQKAARLKTAAVAPVVLNDRQLGLKF